MARLTSNPESSGSKFNEASHERHLQGIDKFVDYIRDSAPEVAKARSALADNLTKAADALSASNPVERIQKQIACETLTLIDGLDKLNHRDYRQLAGLVSQLSDNPDAALLRYFHEQQLKNGSPQLGRISRSLLEILQRLEQLKGIEAGLFVKKDSKGSLYSEAPEKFLADDTCTLMRIACNQGVNVLEPEWKNAQASFNPLKPLEIGLGVFSQASFQRTQLITIEPGDSRAAVSRIKFGAVGKEHEAVLELRDGESVLLGRNLVLSQSQMYRVGLSRDTMASLCAAIRINATSVSRSGMRILKLNGIYVFNNLCRHAWMLRGESMLHPDRICSLMFKGKPVFHDNSWSFGDSIFGQF